MARNSGNFSWDAIWSDDEDQLSLYLQNSGNATPQTLHKEIRSKEPVSEIKRSVSDPQTNNVNSKPAYISDLHSTTLQISSPSQERLFCTPETISTSGKYINQLLSDYGLSTLHGIPLPLKLEEPIRSSELSAIINCLFVLLQSHQKGIEMRDEYNSKIKRITTDRENLAEQKKKLLEKIEVLESDIRTHSQKERSLQESMKKQKEKFEYEKEELLRKVNNLTFKDSQYQHELKKKEIAYDKLKDKMSVLLSDFNNKNSKNTSYGMDSSTKALRTASLDSQVHLSSSNSGMIQLSVHKMMIESYEEKAHVMIEENNLLRNSLIDLKNELSTLQQVKLVPPSTTTSSHNTLQKTSSSSSVQDVDTDADAKNIQLPFSMVKEDIESSFRKKMEDLRQRITKLNQENLLKNEENLSSIDPEIKKCLEEMKKIIDEQDELLQIAVSVSISRPNNIMNESQIAELDEDRKVIASLREELEIQRQRIADESLKLLQERLQFEKDKLKKKDEEEIDLSKILPSPMVSTPWKFDEEEQEGNSIPQTPINKISRYSSPNPSKIRAPSSAPRSNRKTWTLPSTPIQIPKTDDDDDDSDKENKNNPL